MENNTNKTCAIYVRYSGEDDLEDNKGTKSLRNQKVFLTDYADTHNFDIYKIYEDYFKTGTNMDRPGIQELLTDMKAGLFNIILVKDLSRFSRNYIEAGYYFEEVFPKYNIRFISISENYDSNIDDDLLPIRNYINTMYSKDLKKKIRKYYEVTATQKEIIKIPKYGYDKVNGKLVIDQDSAAIVRRIFELANEGYNPDKIARYLKEQKVYSPAYYKKMIMGFHINGKIDDLLSDPYNWQAATVRNMLRDIEYCGHGENIILKGAKNKEKNILLKDAHPAIISEEYFNNTPKYYSKPLKPRERKYLHKIIKCAECGVSLQFYETGKYRCPKCHSKIEAKMIEDLLYDDSVILAREIIDNEKKVLNRFIKAFCDIDVSDLEHKHKEIKKDIMNLIAKRNDISTSHYESEMKYLNKESTKLLKQINELRAQMMSKDELIYRFNKFAKELKLDLNDKLDIIASVIDTCHITFIDNTNIELSIKYKFNS